MRPELLYPFFTPLEKLQGIGPRLSKTLRRLDLTRIIDVLWHLPVGMSYFPLKSSLKECRPGDTVALVVSILAHEAPLKGHSKPYKVACQTGQDWIDLTFFKAYPKTLETRLPVGEKRLVCGTLDQFLGQWQMAHPERIVPPDAVAHWQERSPLYPLTAGFFQSHAQKLNQMALKRIPDLPEWIPSAYKGDWPSWRQALEKVHTPKHEAELLPCHPARQRLAFDELFADQLALNLRRRAQPKGKSIVFSDHLKAKILTEFGHPLTPGQTRALADIERDLKAPTRMVRLLQGDVGSGKTLVAFLASAHAIEAGYQVAILVPTEILATQHAQYLQLLGEKVGIKVALLTSRCKNKTEIYEEIANGNIHLIIGTHALLQEGVQFSNLGLVVIDEQHRFGVEQRTSLTEKGTNVDVLVMTATPIPRTLQLTTYGDLEVSLIPDKPQGRQPIQTRVLGLNRLNEVYDALHHLIEQSHKIYWVCPLVEESESLDLAAAKERYDHLKTVFGEEKVSLLYGRQKADEKNASLSAFKEGSCQILVATTVIEVGIDIKSANIMVIEHAERFGLAQLHQLRGRVGRGNQEARCLLLYGFPISEIGKRRLQVMRETEDGFRIAEEDLLLRGGGDRLGIKQSGLPSYRLADPLTCAPLLEKAHQAAQTLLVEDPSLQSPQGQAARLLLSLFEQEKSIRMLTSG